MSGSSGWCWCMAAARCPNWPMSERSRELPSDELLGELVRDKLIYYPTVTREPFRNRGRITDLMPRANCSPIRSAAAGPAHDRLMLCGSPELLADIGAWLEHASSRGVARRAW